MKKEQTEEEKIQLLFLMLKDFTQAYDEFKGEYERISIEREILPVPVLLYLLLVRVLRFKLCPRPEKTHWILDFKYREINCMVAYQKFGLNLYIEKTMYSKNIYNAILKKFNKAITYMEKNWLQDYVKQKVQEGDVSVENNFIKLSNMYHYFRGKAEESFLVNKDIQMDGFSFGEFFSKTFTHTNEGFYNTIAMIEAYFSRFEYFFIFCIAFNEVEKHNIVEFYKKDWSEKFKIIFPLSIKEHKLFYDEISRIKDNYRNTFAHGMLNKNGEPFHCSLYNAGIVPITLSDYKKSVHFNFYPIQEINFQEICSTFDKIDNWLQNKAKIYEWEYANSGLSLSFNDTFKKKIKINSKSIKAFKEFIKYESLYRDTIENADY